MSRTFTIVDDFGVLHTTTMQGFRSLAVFGWHLGTCLSVFTYLTPDI